MDTTNTHSGNNLKNFTQIPNEILDDTTLSLEEKGTLAIFFRNNSAWKVYVSELRTRSTNGRDATTSIIKKLSQKGYITLVVEKEQCRSVNGHYLNSEKYWALSDKYRQRMTGDWKPVNGERINEVNTLPIKEVNHR